MVIRTERFGVHTSNTIKYNSTVETIRNDSRGELFITLPNVKRNRDCLTQSITYSLNKQKRWELLNHPNVECCSTIISKQKEEEEEKHKEKNRKETNKLNKKKEFEKQLNKNKFQLRKEKEIENKEKLKEKQLKQQALIENKKNEALEQLYGINNNNKLDENNLRILVNRQEEWDWRNKKYREEEKEGDIEILIAPTKQEVYKKYQCRYGEYDSCWYEKECRRAKKEKFAKSIFL
ncbi:hypothetical protein ABK040_015865 [Willaertia magna]